MARRFLALLCALLLCAVPCALAEDAEPVRTDTVTLVADDAGLLSEEDVEALTELMQKKQVKDITVTELAELAETIPYEIMLGFSERVPVEVAD